VRYRTVAEGAYRPNARPGVTMHFPPDYCRLTPIAVSWVGPREDDYGETVPGALIVPFATVAQPVVAIQRSTFLRSG
jgi:hypothetical protein